MPHSRDALRSLLQAAYLCTGFLISPALLIQAQEADDSWFDQQLDSQSSTVEKTGEESDSGAKPHRNASPSAVFNALIKEYERTPEGNLTKRIELLARATQTRPDHSDKAAAKLESLQQQKSNILIQLQRAATLSPIEEAIASLAPYSRSFSLDIALSQTLIESAFATRIENLTSEAASRDDYAAIQSLKDAIQSAGLSNLVRSRIDPLAKDSQNSAIIRKWNAAFDRQAPLKGERFLVERSLQQEDAKLGISIQIESQDEDRLTEALTTGIARHIDGPFEPASADQTDLLITVEIGNVIVNEDIAETTKSSVIPGAIDEQPNPEFVELVTKYEKAAKLYEKAMESYEFQFENWINNRQEGDSEFQQMKMQAQSKMENIRISTSSAAPGSGDPGTSLAEFSAAQAELRAAESLERLSAPLNLPEPIKPTPVHLDILQEVYATPSTIVVSKEETPYDYTSQEIVASFNCKGSLTITNAKATEIADGEPVTLSRKRTYTRNLNVNPRDPVVDAGDYSPQAIDSTKDLFFLEFASECAKKFGDILDEASDRYLDLGLTNRDPQAVVLALSLKASDDGFTLPEDEILKLTKLARDDQVSPQQLRNECLASVARVTLASSPEKQTQVIDLLHL